MFNIFIWVAVFLIMQLQQPLMHYLHISLFLWMPSLSMLFQSITIMSCFSWCSNILFAFYIFICRICMLRLSRRGAAPPRSHTPGPLLVLHWKSSRRRELRSQKFVMLLGKQLSGMFCRIVKLLYMCLMTIVVWCKLRFVFTWILMLNLNNTNE
jgi:hypothetical protein